MSVVLVGLVAVVGLLLPAPAAHAASGERITDYKVTLTARTNGDLHVSEVIDYDFGTSDRHGIQRGIPVEQTWDEDYNRVWELDDIHATRDGQGEQVATDDSGDVTVIRVGKKNKTVSGVQHYQLDYTVRGAFLARNGRVELAWNALGTTTQVPVDHAEVTLVAPDGVRATELGCTFGSFGSGGKCGREGSTYVVTGLHAEEGVTVGYAFPAGSIGGLGPILRHKVTFGYAFTGQLWAIIAGPAAFVVGLLAMLFAWWRRGRDLAFAGQIPGLTPVPGQDSATTAAGDVETSVSFTPPPDVRPAQLGFVMNEGFVQRHITATIVDLAVRGFLRIEEVHDGDDPDSKPTDHRIVSLRGFTRSGRAPASAEHYRGDAADEPNDYELAILRSLFGNNKTEVLLSDKKYHLSKMVTRVRKRLTKQAIERQWFRRDPATVRLHWYVAGGVVLMVGIIGGAIAAIGGAALAGAGLAALGIAAMIVGSKMPRRAPAGTAVHQAGLAFRRYIATAEAERLREQERENVFNRYLPYAIVFDLAEHWVKTFADTMAYADTGGGYFGAPYYAAWYAGSHGFDSFTSGLSSFGSSVSATLATQSSGGSSGGSSFSSVGGGGGGGGVGSW